MSSNPPVVLMVTALSNETTLPVTFLLPPPPGAPPGTPPLTLVVPPESNLPLGPDTTPIPPQGSNEITVSVAGAPLCSIYTDGSGVSYISSGSTSVTMDRTALPNQITIAIAPGPTVGTITSAGFVPIYTLSLV